MLVGILWSQLAFRPQRLGKLDKLTGMSLTVLVITVAIGMFFVPPADRANSVTPVWRGASSATSRARTCDATLKERKKDLRPLPGVREGDTSLARATPR